MEISRCVRLFEFIDVRRDDVMWMSSRSDSAAKPPSAEQLVQWRERMSPPEHEFPATVGLTVLLGRTDDAAVGLTNVEAFSTGFRFTLGVRVRQPRPQFARGGLHILISSHVHPGIDVPLEDRLLLGIEYPDGRRASTLTDMRVHGPGAMTDGEQLALVQQGGGGGERSVDQSYWVAPLPSQGPVTVVLAWRPQQVRQGVLVDHPATLASHRHRSTHFTSGAVTPLGHDQLHRYSAEPHASG
jgi:hypothetical protein